MIHGAIRDAELSLDEIDYIQAHAAGTVTDDMTEAAVLEDVFGAKIKTIPVVSVKSMIGHTQGACGVIETAAAALSIYKGVILRECQLRYGRSPLPVADQPLSTCERVHWQDVT